MNITFNTGKLVNKTFDKATSWERGQDYEGIKWRKFTSKAGKEEGEAPDVKTNFEVSEKLFKELNLEGDMTPETSLGFFQYDADPENGIVLLLLTDNEHANMMNRTGRHKDNKPKGRRFINSYLDRSLFTAGILEDTMGSQYLKLEAVELDEAPEWVLKSFKVVKDESVKADSEDSEDSENTNESIQEGDIQEGDTQEQYNEDEPQKSQDDFDL